MKKKAKRNYEFNPEDVTASIGTFKTGREAYLGDVIDSYTGAPFRRGISELQEGNYRGALGAAWDQMGQDPESVPTMEDIAIRAGVPEGYLSQAAGVIGSFAEPGLPFGSAMGVVRRAKKLARRAKAAKISEDMAQVQRAKEAGKKGFDDYIQAEKNEYAELNRDRKKSVIQEILDRENRAKNLGYETNKTKVYASEFGEYGKNPVEIYDDSRAGWRARAAARSERFLSKDPIQDTPRYFKARTKNLLDNRKKAPVDLVTNIFDSYRLPKTIEERSHFRKALKSSMREIEERIQKVGKIKLKRKPETRKAAIRDYNRLEAAKEYLEMKLEEINSLDVD